MLRVCSHSSAWLPGQVKERIAMGTIAAATELAGIEDSDKPGWPDEPHELNASEPDPGSGDDEDDEDDEDDDGGAQPEEMPHP